MLRLVTIALVALGLAGGVMVRPAVAQVAGAGVQGDRQNTNAIRSIITDRYLITVGDTLGVTVVEDSSLNQSLLVRPDGKVSMPLVGTVMAAGRTPEQVQASIRAALRDDFVQPPTVTVAVTGVSQFRDEPGSIYVIGQVGRPGKLEFDQEKPLSILQALSLAGGPGVFAATERIQIRRKLESGGEIVELFNYEDILDGSGLPDHMPLGDGDVIVVPERGLFD